jgi:hypothetical protein
MDQFADHLDRFERAQRDAAEKEAFAKEIGISDLRAMASTSRGGRRNHAIQALSTVIDLRFQVLVKAPFFGDNPKTIAVIIHPLDRVSDIQQRIHQMGGPPGRFHNLIFDGRSLDKAGYIGCQGVGAGAFITSNFRVTLQTGGSPPPIQQHHRSSSAAGPSQRAPLQTGAPPRSLNNLMLQSMPLEDRLRLAGIDPDNATDYQVALDLTRPQLEVRLRQIEYERAKLEKRRRQKTQFDASKREEKMQRVPEEKPSWTTSPSGRGRTKREAAEIVKDQLQRLYDGTDLPEGCQPQFIDGVPLSEEFIADLKKRGDRGLDEDLRDAALFREEMDTQCACHVCAICSTYLSITNFEHSSDLEGKEVPIWTNFSKIKNLHLLSSSSLDHLTRYRSAQGKEYCIQPDFCKREDGTDKAQVCKACVASLARGKLPAWSLSRFDAGGIPRSSNEEEQLLPLTMIEQNLIAVNRVMRQCYVIMPSKSENDSQLQMRGHVVAFPNNSVDELLEVLPLPIDKIPEVMQVVFLYVASEDEKEKRRKVAKAARALHVRGKQIALWAKHLCKVSGCSEIQHQLGLRNSISLHAGSRSAPA